MSTKLDFQLKLLVHRRQLELSFFKIVAKHILFLFRLTGISYIVLVIRVKIIFISIKALYLEKKACKLIDVSMLCVLLCPYVGYTQY